MNTVRCRGVTVVLVCALAMALVSAQITFSRDWTGGKRAAPMAIDCGQFTRLCRHFVHELKQAMSSESKRRREEEPSPAYDDDN
ncbi:uncharacterized protein LOC135082604 isoform X2 [Ostrinia nubilalis]|uniref:uncharacterized protein LOC135082604 isoform X2 n=1 Tax=Ostrinia nubilalis TaxID=29057 RepID=UPI0030823C56